MIKIYCGGVNASSGDSVVPCSPQDTIDSIMMDVQDMTGIPVKEQRHAPKADLPFFEPFEEKGGGGSDIPGADALGCLQIASTTSRVSRRLTDGPRGYGPPSGGRGQAVRERCYWKKHGPGRRPCSLTFQDPDGLAFSPPWPGPLASAPWPTSIRR